MKGLIVYEGPSRINGAPIVVIVTAISASKNSKTGNLVQSYILRADLDPVTAAQMLELPKRERERLHYLPPSKDRWKLRSATYKGIAEAMAQQWGTKEKRNEFI